MRDYASFWEGKNKALKEGGVVQDFLAARERIGLEPYVDVRPFAPDPPDFQGRRADGELVGIELTELVSQEAIEHNARTVDRAQHIYRHWSMADVVRRLEDILAEKDARVFNGGPYAEIVLVIHTDEQTIQASEVERAVGAHRFQRPRQISHAYVLISYDPRVEYYPLIALSFI